VTEGNQTEIQATRQSAGGPVAAHMGRSLWLLRQAYEYAAELRRDVWDFAVEISSLREVGVSNSDLRWLVCKEYVDHAVEIALMTNNGREFHRSGPLTFGERTCFVLTEEGARLAANVGSNPHDQRAQKRNGSPTVDPLNGDRVADLPHQLERPQVPRWDCERHELRLGDVLVKVFKLPSRNQETILMAFEEENWPSRIDDPLPPHPDLVPKRRLHDAIKGLNRNQKTRAIRFMGDGTGEGVRWELCSGSNA